MRLAVAVIIGGASLALAVFFHQQTIQRPVGCENPACQVSPAWADPVAILTATLGAAIVIALLLPERRKRPALKP